MMTTRTILLTLAASVAPLYAQQPATPAPAAEVFTAMAAPATPAQAASADQRAEVFSALALLPQDIPDVAVLTNVGGNLLSLAQSGRLPELDAGDIPAELLSLDNIALANTAATPATSALLQRVLISLSTVQSSVELAEKWGADARDELSDAIIEELLLRADAGMALPEGATEGVRLPTSYAIVTTKAGEEALVQECAALLLSSLQEETRPGITAVNDANGFSGIRMDVVETFRAELEEATQDMAPRRREQLLAELAQHPLHILLRQQGNALILALCEDPQELKLAASPAESLLATDKLAACDANLGKRLLAAARISPELSAACQAVHEQPTYRLAEGISAVFTRLGGQDSANKEAFDKAAAGISFLSAELRKLSRPITRPSTLQLWCDGDLHLTATSDAQGCSYCPGELRLVTMASAPQTSLYAESTPMQLGLNNLPDAQALLEAAFATAEGFALTVDGEERTQTAAAISTVKTFLPELQALAAASSTVCSGLNGQTALVMDSAYTPIPPVAGAQPGTHADAPRFAIYAGVSDRSKLSSGWEDLRAAAGQIAVKFGAPAEIVNMLPIASKQEGAAMSYSISLPFFSQDAVPCLAVTDSGLTLGSSVNLTTKVANSATGTTPFAGAAFALKFAPLAKTLRSLATALDHDAEEAEPAANSDVRLEKEGSAPVAVIGGPNGPTSIFLCTRTADAEDAADQLSTAAAIFEFASTIAEGLYATSTTAEGLHTLHMEIKMK